MIRFRSALLILLTGLVLTTVVAVGIFSHLEARWSAEELAGQVLHETLARIHEEINDLLSEAHSEGALTVELLKARQLKSHDFDQLASFWESVLRVNPEMRALFLGLEATGEAMGIWRLPDDFLIWQTRRNPDTNSLELREYSVKNLRRDSVEYSPNAPDIRLRPWYAAARAQRRPIWTKAYRFMDLKDLPPQLGLTYAMPVIDDDGNVEAVVSADFDLTGLGQYLATLRVGIHGSAFIAEWDESGTLQVIAKPVRTSAIADHHFNTNMPSHALPTSKESDNREHAFLASLPPMTETRGLDSGTVRFKLNGEKYLGQFQRTQRDGCSPRLIGTFLPERGIMAYADETMRFTIYITLGVIGATVLLSFWLSRQVAQPLERLTEEVAKVGQMHLGPNRHISSVVREVDRLALAAEEMKAGLRSFRKYVPADLVRKVLSTGREARLGGELRRVTISFSDIVGFTSISEKMPSDLLVRHLGDYLAALSEEIMQLGGTVDKFIGDAIMAFWGAPAEHPDHATAACVAALRCRQRLREMAPIWEAAGKPPLRTRFGIHTGEVIVGNIGSPQRMNYTIIGDAVNLASRMEGLNKHYGTEILLSEETYREAHAAIVARPLDWVVVKGRGSATQIYELLGMAADVDGETAEFAELYTTALALYRAQRWTDALIALDDLVHRHPDDAPSQLLLKRCQEFTQSPPAGNWDGVAHMLSK